MNQLPCLLKTVFVAVFFLILNACSEAAPPDAGKVRIKVNESAAGSAV